MLPEHAPRMSPLGAAPPESQLGWDGIAGAWTGGSQVGRPGDGEFPRGFPCLTRWEQLVPKQQEVKKQPGLGGGRMLSVLERVRGGHSLLY